MKVRNYIVITIIGLTFLLQSCQQPGVNSTGSEYMPDMGHSIAYEANYYNYYYNNTWGSEDDYYKYAMPKEPVKGTVPRRGDANIALPTQGSVPYYYADTEEERTRAINELVDNPLPITAKGLAEGKELYNVFCATCHGEKADGNGYLVRDDGGVYPAQPANFLLEEHVNASNGRYYHAIMHGKNVMGGYSDKISYEERWNVIHYIRSLQAKELKLVYNQTENTLNTVDRPAGENYIASKSTHMVEMDHEDNHHHIDGEHSEAHSHDGHEEDHHGIDGHHDDHGHGDDHDHDHGH